MCSLGPSGSGAHQALSQKRAVRLELVCLQSSGISSLADLFPTVIKIDACGV